MTTLHIWLLSIRPKTLSLSLTPVMVGTCLAWVEQARFNGVVLMSILCAALCIQIGTNLHNDAADYERGADTPERLGPPRATAQGWLSARAVKQGALLSFSLAFLFGLYPVAVGGWPIVWLGLLSLTAGYGYTGGPKPIAYTPLGELFVFLFFGLAAVSGTYYLHTLTITPATLLCASAIGLLAAAVLMVNNYRDRDTDTRSGKHTLAVLLGRKASRWLYALFLTLPPIVILPLYSTHSLATLLPWLSLLPGLFLVRKLFVAPIDTGLNRLLAGTAQLQLLFGVLLCLSLLLG